MFKGSMKELTKMKYEREMGFKNSEEMTQATLAKKSLENRLDS